jgi:hypothetical protein
VGLGFGFGFGLGLGLGFGLGLGLGVGLNEHPADCSWRVMTSPWKSMGVFCMLGLRQRM